MKLKSVSTCMKRRHARGTKSPLGVQAEFAATHREPLRKTVSSIRLSFVSMGVLVPCCTALGGLTSALMVRSVVVKVTPAPTPGVPVTDQIRMLVAGCALSGAKSTAAMKRDVVDDREWAG